MTQTIVDRLEAIQVDEEHGKAMSTIALGSTERLCQSIEEQGAVRQPCERVMQRLMREQCSGMFALGNILGDTEDAGNLVADDHRHQRHLYIDFLALLMSD